MSAPAADGEIKMALSVSDKQRTHKKPAAAEKRNGRTGSGGRGSTGARPAANGGRRSGGKRDLSSSGGSGASGSSDGEQDVSTSNFFFDSQSSDMEFFLCDRRVSRPIFHLVHRRTPPHFFS